MPSITLNGQTIPQANLVKLGETYQSKLGTQVAIDKIKDNQLDEVIYEYEGDKYILFTNQGSIDALKDSNNSLKINGKEVHILSISNEQNSRSEKNIALTHKALGATVSDGLGGMAAGVAVVLLKLTGSRTGTGIALGGLVGFVTGAIKGAGTEIIQDKSNRQPPNWESIMTLIDQ